MAEQLGVSSEALRSYENGAAAPMPDKVRRMAEVLRFPEHFFSASVQKNVSPHVFWRDLKSVTKASREAVDARVVFACEVFSTLEDYVEFPSLNLPSLKLPSHWSDISEYDIEAAAEACRLEWGLGEYPIPDITLAIENIGIPVLAPMIENRKQSGFAHWDEVSQRPFVGHNKRHTTAARARFNLAHELGHILLHQSVSDDDLENKDYFDHIEMQAHRFAGALLFPRTAFYREVRYASLSTFELLKRDWNIAITAQIVRAKQLGVIDENRATSLFVAAGREGYRSPQGEPYDDIVPVEEPRMLRRAVDAIEEAGEMHLEVLKHRIPLPEDEVRELVGRSFEPTVSNVVSFRKLF
ncbi:Zn-dependent peptidase ImmA (M78 family) [Sagittula marina]|uniref:Zn-dependent peptidase ImmA (M78 family) n=1 Tax=Sagittula marina TaxID=943940 RepID=A0A7W6DZX0_9RHOB|nr:Zn-dependent peptidase ImmA (M78 family) [Sagittula marina]